MNVSHWIAATWLFYCFYYHTCLLELFSVPTSDWIHFLTVHQVVLALSVMLLQKCPPLFSIHTQLCILNVFQHLSSYSHCFLYSVSPSLIWSFSWLYAHWSPFIVFHWCSVLFHRYDMSIPLWLGSSNKMQYWLHIQLLPMHHAIVCFSVSLPSWTWAPLSLLPALCFSVLL